MSDASGNLRRGAEPGDAAIRFAVVAALLATLVLSLRAEYVLFHTLVELYAVAVALGICAVGWTTRGQGRADFLKVLGVGFGCSGCLDLLHALSYPDLGLFPGLPVQATTQFWIAGRFAETAAVVAAPLFLRRRIDTRLLVFGAGAALLAAIALILTGRFPDCWIPGEGMTRFKIGGEYLVVALSGVALALFLRMRRSLAPSVLALLAASLVCTMAAELAFTAYRTYYDSVHMAGHVLRLAAYYLMYRALLVAGFRAPLDLIFFSFALDRVREAAFLVRESGRIEYVNGEACRSLGYREDELLCLTLADVDPDLTPERWAERWRLLRAERVRHEQGRRRAKDGRTFPVDVSISSFEFAGREYALTLARDIGDRLRAQAEREQLRDQLARAERLDAVGRLAGGVAHDLNNVLMPVLGYAELLLDAAPPGSEEARDLAEVKRAAERAKELTGQLLAFGRRQVLALRPVDLRGRLARMEGILRATLRPDIAVDVRLPATLGTVRADAGQIDEAVMTLALSAQRAMPSGGLLTLEASDAEVGADHPAAARGVPPGRWVMLSVSDTGPAMDHEQLQHVFEPFYGAHTARGGTGLGVSIVHGIVTQHGGVVYAESAPGRGNAFRILLPREAQEPAVAAPEPEAPRAAAGEAIVLAEDEEAVRTVAARMLEGLGYRVVAAGSAEECLRFVQDRAAPVDLLVTDVVMPGLDGRQLHERIAALRPGIPVVYMSGYPGEALALGGIPAGAVLLGKPFTVQALGEAVHRALAERRPARLEAAR